MKHLPEGMLDEIKTTQYEGDKIVSNTVPQLGVTANGFTSVSCV
jgi:hypothetical protein